jgi:predicted HTH transcriptional regulator
MLKFENTEYAAFYESSRSMNQVLSFETLAYEMKKRSIEFGNSQIYRMNLIESYGTGIGKIQRMYDGFEKQPEFETAQGVFRVTLPNCNEMESMLLHPATKTTPSAPFFPPRKSAGRGKTTG